MCSYMFLSTFVSCIKLGYFIVIVESFIFYVIQFLIWEQQTKALSH